MGVFSSYNPLLTLTVGMKRIYLLLACAAIGSSAMAQSAKLAPAKGSKDLSFDRALQPTKILTPSEEAASLKRMPVAGPRAVQNAPTTDWADMVGFTFFDLQTYGSNSNLIQNYAGGNLSITYMLGLGRSRGSRLAGYNHYDAAAGRWMLQSAITNPGSTADSNLIACSPLAPRSGNTPIGTNFNNGRIGWPNLIHNATKEAVAAYAVYPGDASGLTRIHTLEAGGAGKFAGRLDMAPVFDTLPRQLDKEAVFHVTASDGVTSYLLTESGDTDSYPNLLAGGTVNNLILYRTTDNGRNWAPIFIDKLSAANGIGGIKGTGYAVDCRGSEVAVVAQVMTARPDNGVASYLFRSSDFGNTWRSKLIQKRTTADTSFRVGSNFCLATDGSFSVVIDNNNKAHVTSHAGYQTLDSAGTATGTFFRNGGFSNLAASGLYYFNEDMPDNGDFREITGLVDVNKDGNLTIPGSTSAAAPGLYPVCGLSMSNLTVGPNNELFITYSALVEGTELSSNSRITRDVYVMASYDNGRSWTNPINVAGRLAVVNGFTFDDGSTGSGLYEETWTHAVKRIGTDGKLHILFMSDDIAGQAESSTGNFSWAAGWETWRNNAINHYAIPIENISNSILRTAVPFPTQVCAGSTGVINVIAPANQFSIYGPITANSVFIAELDTTNTGAFAANGTVVLGTFTGSATGGAINVTYPAGFTGLAKIRVRINNGDPSALPAVYESSTGAYDITITTGVPANTGAVTNRLASGGSIAAGGTICANVSAMFNVPTVGNANLYEWSVNPPAAGSIQINGDGSLGGNFALATFNASATGPVTVSVKAINGCGESAVPSTFSFNLGGGTATIDNAARTITASSTGGAWETSGAITGPFVPLASPVTSSVLDLNANPANTPEDQFYRYTVGGCATNIVFFRALSLSNTKLAGLVNVYPNPATNHFNVTVKGALNGATNVAVFNAMGQLVKGESFDAANGGTLMNTAGMSKGIYFVRISNGGATTTKRLVVE